MMDRVASFEEDFDFNDNASTSTKNKSPTSTRSRFARIAQGLANKRRATKWRQLIEATRNKVIPFSRSQDSIESDAIGEAIPVHQRISDTTSMKLDANLRRQIYALKLESVSLSQPALPSGAVSAAMSNAACTTFTTAVPTGTAGCSKLQPKALPTIATKTTNNEATNPVETKVVENKNTKTLPCDIIAMKKDDWI